MNEFFRKLLKENNLIIVIPAIIVTLIITAFFLYGFSDPQRTEVPVVHTLAEVQMMLEEDMITEYSEGVYTPSSPYFKLNPYGTSPLSGLIMFETDTPTSYKIIVKGRTDEADFEFVSPLATSHQIPVYGLYPLYSNQIKICEYNIGTKETGDILTTISVPTTQLPGNVEVPTSIETTYEYFGNDLMLLTPAVDSLPVAYDFNGDVRWYSTEILAFAPDFLDNGHLLIGTNRIISDPYYTTGLFEIDLLGKIYNEYYIPGGYHHDAYEMPDGNLLVLSNDFNGTVEDIVVEIDRDTGRIVKTWDIADYLPTTDGMASMWTAADWFHNNSVDYDETTDSIILSGRHQDVVISIGYTSNELNWVFGDPKNWDEDFVDEYFFNPISIYFDWQYAQHGAIILPDGNLFVFDNGNNRAKYDYDYVEAMDNYSRGVIYRLDTENMNAYQIYEFGKELGTDFYSPYISNVAYYGENHYMIHSGGISSSSIEGALNIPAPLYSGDGVVTMNSITIEVLDNNIEYRLEVPNNFYRAVRFSPYNEMTSFHLGSPNILGVQQVNEQYYAEVKSKLSIFKNVPRSHELTLEKQSDRLRVDGIFDRADLIYLILRNDDGDIVYHIPTSRTAYTAMCTAVFQGDERYITFYINEQNMKGNYNVYININGYEYDTYQKVEFN